MLRVDNTKLAWFILNSITQFRTRVASFTHFAIAKKEKGKKGEKVHRLNSNSTISPKVSLILNDQKSEVIIKKWDYLLLEPILKMAHE